MMADDIDLHFHESHSRLEWAMTRAGLGLCTVVTDGTILGASGELVRMLGYSTRADIDALNLARDVCADSDECARVLEAAVSIEPTWVETRWKRRDGSLFVVRV